MVTGSDRARMLHDGLLSVDSTGCWCHLVNAETPEMITGKNIR